MATHGSGAASAPQAVRYGIPSYESKGSDALVQARMITGSITLPTSREAHMS